MLAYLLKNCDKETSICLVLLLKRSIIQQELNSNDLCMYLCDYIAVKSNRI